MRQLFYNKMQQKFITRFAVFFITKCDSLLQKNTVITKCDNFIAECDSYYKMRRYNIEMSESFFSFHLKDMKN